MINKKKNQKSSLKKYAELFFVNIFFDKSNSYLYAQNKEFFLL